MNPVTFTFSDPIHLLWTGGWDSTFRLLQIVLVQQRRVQPHYLIDRTRSSLGNELKAMSRIKPTLRHRFPQTEYLILPTIYADVADIPRDNEISQAHARIGASRHFGSQYDWLARYCKANNIERMELGLEADPEQPEGLWPFLTRTNYHGTPKFKFSNLLNVHHTEYGPVHIFDESLCSQDEFTLLKYFYTSIFSLTKEDIGRLAHEHGWEDVMHMTWFCHRPLFGRVPCGQCNPCTDALHEGLSYRIPLIGKLSGILTTAFRVRTIRKALTRFLKTRSPVK